MDDSDSSDTDPAHCIILLTISGITCTHKGVGLCLFASNPSSAGRSADIFRRLSH